MSQFNSLTNNINLVLKTVISDIFPEIIDTSHYCVYQGVTTDYQFTKVKALANFLKLSAILVADKLYISLSKHKIIEFVQIINNETQLTIVFNIDKYLVENMVNELYSQTLLTKTLPCPVLDIPKKLVVDFSSPNIAKQMHVGHLRSTIIGESICRLFEYCGSKVNRINHIGDWGTQFGMLIAYMKQTQVFNFDLANLMQNYKNARQLFVSDVNFVTQALEETVKLQNYDNENIGIWQEICRVSIESFNEIYQELQTHAEIKGESFYQDRMKQMVLDLKDIIEVNELKYRQKHLEMISVETNEEKRQKMLDKINKMTGVKTLFVDDFDIPLILVKSDGGFTYDTSDLAAIHYRLVEQACDQVIYVVDIGQKQHLDIVFKAAQQFGWAKDKQLVHVGFGLVLGSNGSKLKTRSGETITLRSLLDDAYDYTRKITMDMAKERHPDWDNTTINNVSRRIAINCIKYTDLKNPRLTDYKFVLDKMVNNKGDTAVYLMYALARCKSILRKVPNLETVLQGEIILDSNEARKLAFKILRYGEVIQDTIRDIAPHYLCKYLYDIVCTLTTYYDKSRCLDFNDQGQLIKVHDHRIRLINMTLLSISQIFYLIGLEEIEQI